MIRIKSARWIVALGLDAAALAAALFLVFRTTEPSLERIRKRREIKVLKGYLGLPTTGDNYSDTGGSLGVEFLNTVNPRGRTVL
ncbi:MAG: hypothetical protein R6V25_00605 [Desulfatiglandales bacterium]